MIGNPPIHMYIRRCTLVFTFLLLSWTSCLAAAPGLSSFVDPLIGTSPNPYTKIGYAFDTGNVFPGAVCPRGMVAWSPDTTHAANIAGGYWYPDNQIDDFSLTHFSGRGVPCLKDIAFMPFPGEVTTSPGKDWSPYAVTYSHQNEKASAGYYRVKLDNGIEAELTATPRTGLARFTFPSVSTATLLIRANGAISVTGSEASGYADKGMVRGTQHLYFFAQFSQPVKSVRTWVNDQITDQPSAEGKLSGAILAFDLPKGGSVEARVGISYTSLENARDNLNKENRGWDIGAVRQEAEALWDHELGRIEVEGGTDAQKKVFYTALYHCFMHPNFLEDANGQYPGMDGKIHTVEAGRHQYQNIPAWDEHRSHAPLMAIIAANESSDVMQSLVNYAQQDASVHPNGGGMPRWEQMNANSGGMAGDGDDTIIATSYAFGATRFDTKGAWEAMDKGASQPGTTSDGRKVRDGLDVYISKGYVPEKAAITLEYCTDDFSLSQMAKSLGEDQKALAYLNRAQNWKNLFDSSTGYIRPRSKDGAWLDPFTPNSGKGFIEGTASQYLWMVNFDLGGLASRLGGNEKTNERLDTFFTQTNAGLRSAFAYMGNEPCEETPWVYDFTSSPRRTQQIVRRIQNELFTTQPSGIPGNDDAGSLSSWYVFSALGIYPEIPGMAGFVTGSPVFPKAIIHLDNGGTIEITGKNASPENCYVKSLALNGQPYQSPWIPWARLAHGGTIAFDLADKPSNWGEDPRLAPPSFDSPAASASTH